MRPASPAKRDFAVYRGSNAPVIQMRLKNPDGSLQDLTGHDLVLTVALPEGPISARLSDGGMQLDESGVVSWAPSFDQSRSIRVGRLTPYAIERIEPSGAQSPLIVGMLIGRDYPNGD